MIIQKNGERSAAKVMGVIASSLSIIIMLTGLVFLIIYPIQAAKYAPRGGLGTTWIVLFNAIGWGGLFGGLGCCVICVFTLKTLYTSNSFAPMLIWAIVNIIFVITIPLSVVMAIIAFKECRHKK